MPAVPALVLPPIIVTPPASAVPVMPAPLVEVTEPKTPLASAPLSMLTLPAIAVRPMPAPLVVLTVPPLLSIVALPRAAVPATPPEKPVITPSATLVSPVATLLLTLMLPPTNNRLTPYPPVEVIAPVFVTAASPPIAMLMLSPVV